ncbi:Uncharacterised protein [Vibrio cholerae]|nr:Uncharacterised protein [Vibrio cholerae]
MVLAFLRLERFPQSRCVLTTAAATSKVFSRGIKPKSSARRG